LSAISVSTVPGVDAVNANAVRPELVGERADEALDPVLGRDVMRLVRCPLQTGHGADEHDAAAAPPVDHPGDHRFRRVPRADEVDVEDLLPVVVGQLVADAWLEMPALDTRMSIPPSVSVASATTASSAA
jgi:hypothetical protein